MGENVLKLIYYILYSLELFLVGESIFHNRVKNGRRYIVVGVVYLSIIISMVVFVGKPSYLIVLILNILMYVLLFQGEILSRLLHFLGVYLFTGIMESMVSGIGTFFVYQFIKKMGVSIALLEIRVIVAGIAAVFALVVANRKWMQKFIGYFQALKWFQCFAIIMIAISGTSLMAMSEVVLEYIDNKEVGAILHVVTILLLGTTFIGIIWFIYTVYDKEYYLKQNYLKEEIIHTQQQYYQNIYENDREMRKFRHDIHSQLGCLQLLLAEGKMEQALKYLETIEKNFQKLTVCRYRTGNEIVDVIINQKCLEAKSKNIEIKFEGKIERIDSINEYDLCTIFANALANGIEAMERLADGEKIIDVSIITHGKSLFFQFSNFATMEMYEAVKQNRTTKEDKQNHGFGVENIRTAVERNGGEAEYRYVDKKLFLEIYFER